MPDLRLVESTGDGAAVVVHPKAKAKGPRRSKAERAAVQNVRKTIDADARVDADLSRAIDAIAFLSQNEIDPAPLIARISPMEAEAVSGNLRKAVDWLNRFAEGWHVFIGNVEIENAAPRAGFETGRSGAIRLVRCRD